jgi:hypothetical protein
MYSFLDNIKKELELSDVNTHSVAVKLASYDSINLSNDTTNPDYIKYMDRAKSVISHILASKSLEAMEYQRRVLGDPSKGFISHADTRFPTIQN